MTAKVLATITTLIGAASVIYALLGAWGIDLSQEQQDAATGALGLVLIVSGIWFHPSVPVGTVEEKP